MRKNTLSVIICVFNEIKTIGQILKKVENAELPKNWNREIIIIDNCSNDGTVEYLNQINDHKIIFQKKI